MELLDLANYEIGIDFGTTRIVVAFVDAGNYPVVTFEPPTARRATVSAAHRRPGLPHVVRLGRLGG